MNTTGSLVVLFFFIVAGIAVAIYCRRDHQRRLSYLRETGLVYDPTRVQFEELRRFVEIDLGYGREVWGLLSDDLAIEPINRSIVGGFLIEPENVTERMRKRIERCGGVRIRST